MQKESKAPSMNHGLAVIVSSPSGGGKTTVVEELLKRHKTWKRSVSVTTRMPRSGEKHGFDYFFVSNTEFENLKNNNGLLEYAKVYENQYGTPRAYVEEQIRAGHVSFLTVDVQGARSIQSIWRDQASLLTIFIMPPSIDLLRERLSRRNTENPEQVAVRLAAAQGEMEQASFYDFTVYNHSLEQTVHDIEQLILEKKKGESNDICSS